VFHDGQRCALLRIALDAIRTRLERRPDQIPDVDEIHDPVLRAPSASFVTLQRERALLGCIGSLTPNCALAVGVAQHALSAAFADPRLPPITVDEYAVMSVKVSVLSALEPMAVTSVAELLDAVAPGVDGLVVAAGSRRATLLPSVWADVPDPRRFLDVLWAKAGLTPGTWPADAAVSRYATEEFGDLGPRRLLP
jgi:AmmeMemoRadiSam system protein A